MVAKSTKSPTFQVDMKGLSEVIGGAESWRHVNELIANVFDEFNGYDHDTKRPTNCEVTFTKEGRKNAILTVTDDGAGFAEISDTWTFFRSTAKRSSSTVSGRFNAGEKQLIALADEAEIISGSHTVKFAKGSHKHTKHKTEQISGTRITVSLKWNAATFQKALEQLENVIAPSGLIYTVNGKEINNGSDHVQTVNVSLPTVILSDVDGVFALRSTVRKTDVEIIRSVVPWLYELGMPVCEMPDEFPYSLNVQQKVPVPMSRDMVTPAYVARLGGTVIEACPAILSEAHADAAFVKPMFDHIKNPQAVREVSARVFPKSKRWSSNPRSNAMATLEGNDILPRGKFGSAFTSALNDTEAIPSASAAFPVPDAPPPKPPESDQVRCPSCDFSFKIKKVTNLIGGLV